MEEKSLVGTSLLTRSNCLKYTILVLTFDHITHMGVLQDSLSPFQVMSSPARAVETSYQSLRLSMIQLPNLELKAERRELIELMCVPFQRAAGYEHTKVAFTRFVQTMGNRSVMDCLSVMRRSF